MSFGINPWTTADVARLPAPIGAEAALVPTDHGLRLNDDDRVEQRRVLSIRDGVLSAVLGAHYTYQGKIRPKCCALSKEPGNGEVDLGRADRGSDMDHR
jgi:hypothetical protein